MWPRLCRIYISKNEQDLASAGNQKPKLSGDTTLWPFSNTRWNEIWRYDFESFLQIEMRLWILSSIGIWLWVFSLTRDEKKFEDTTLDSFFNRDSTLSHFPNITLSYSSSEGWLWIFICLKDMHVWMHGNFEFIFLNDEWNFEFLIMNVERNFEFWWRMMHVWMQEILSFFNENACLNAGWFDLCLFEECMTFFIFLDDN